MRPNALRFALLLSLAGCAMGSSGTAVPPGTRTVSVATPAANDVTFSIVIPNRAASAALKRRQYVSPATQSVAIAVDSGTPTVANLTPGSANCVVPQPLGSLTCTVGLDVPSGMHTFAIALYDTIGATGSVLSVNSVAQTIDADTANQIAVTLAGVPASIEVTPLAPSASIAGNQVTGFTYLASISMTSTSQPMLIVAKDADQNYIIGPGSPALSVRVSGATAGSGIAVTRSGSNPNGFTLTSSGFGHATLGVTATAGSSLAGPALSISVPVATAALTSTIAGTPYATGATNATGSAATFDDPYALAFDTANGALIVADSQNCRIRQVTTAGVVTAVAGSGTCGSLDGPATVAEFNSPYGVTYDAGNGDTYVADVDNCTIRQVTALGVVTTVAGSAGSCSFADGAVALAKFQYPQGVAFDSATGDLYVADTANCAIRQVTLAGMVTTFAGQGGFCSFQDGVAGNATFYRPNGIAYDSANGDLYVTDSANCTIRQITSGAAVTTVAGAASNCRSGDVDGIGSGALLNSPSGITYDASDDMLYFTDTENCSIRQFSPTTHAVVTIAGNGSCVFKEGLGSDGRFNVPSGVTYDPVNGQLYVTDTGNSTIRMVTL